MDFTKKLNHGDKGENQFKFQSFTERINSINVDIARKITSEIDEANTDSSYFEEGLEKWRELDCTNEFQTFYFQVRNLCKSLPMLLLNKEKIVEILLDNLKDRNESTNSILSLLSTLSRDLRSEFYPYFDRVFAVLVNLINPNDPELLENIFVCIAYLLKYLLKQMIQNLSTVFTSSFQTLLGHKKDFIRHFSAEVFAYLLRKVKSDDELKVIYQAMLANLNESLIDGVGWALFYSFTSIQNSFHSSISRIKLFFHVITNDNIDVLQILTVLLCDHARLETCTPMWDIIMELLIVNHFKGMKMLVSWCKHRHGTRIKDIAKVVNILQKCNASKEVSTDIGDLFQVVWKRAARTNENVIHSQLSRLSCVYQSCISIPLLMELPDPNGIFNSELLVYFLTEIRKNNTEALLALLKLLKLDNLSITSVDELSTKIGDELVLNWIENEILKIKDSLSDFEWHLIRLYPFILGAKNSVLKKLATITQFPIAKLSYVLLNGSVTTGSTNKNILFAQDNNSREFNDIVCEVIVQTKFGMAKTEWLGAESQIIRSIASKSIFKGSDQMSSLCSEMVATCEDISLQTVREISLRLTTALTLPFSEPLLHICLGFLYVGFSTVHDLALTAISSLAKMQGKIVYNTCWDRFENIIDKPISEAARYATVLDRLFSLFANESLVPKSDYRMIKQFLDRRIGLPRNQMLCYLSIFKGYKVIDFGTYQDTMKQICLELLDKSEFQAGALNILLGYSSILNSLDGVSYKSGVNSKPSVNLREHSDLLNGLIGAAWRANLPLFTDNISHHQDVMFLVCKILYSKLSLKKASSQPKSGATGGKNQSDSSKTATKNASRTVFSFLSTFRQLGYVVDRLVQLADEISNLEEQISSNLSMMDSSVELEEESKKLSKTRNSKRAAFLRISYELVFTCKHALSDRILDLLGRVENVLVSILNGSSNAGKKIRSDCYLVISIIFETFPKVVFTKLHHFLRLLLPTIYKLKQENTQSREGIWNILVAMTCFDEYIPALLQLPELFPAIFETLTSKSIHGSVVSAILDICENLIEKQPVILSNNMSILLTGLKSVLVIELERGVYPKRVVLLVSQIAPMLTEVDETASQLCAIVIPLLTTKPKIKINEEVKRQILELLFAMLPFLPDASLLLSPASRLFLQLNSTAARNTLVKLYLRLGEIIQKTENMDVAKVSLILSDLNSFEATTLEEPNFALRNSAYSSIESQRFTDFELVPIVSSLLFYVSAAEFSIRSRSVQTIVKLLSHLNSSLITTLVLPTVLKGLKSHEEQIRRDFLSLLGHLIRAFPELLSGYTSLISSDLEADLLENISHIQQHRRLKALQKLSVLCSNKLPSSVALHLIPLIMHFIYEDCPNHVQDEAIKAVGSLCSVMGWTAYYKTINNIIKQIPFHSDREKILIRVVCSVLDAWNFSTAEPKIKTMLVSRLIPLLYKHLLENKSFEMVRVSVALALVKLLMKIPDNFEKEFPRLLTILCNHLGSRVQSVRIVSRETLVSIAIAVGSKYFHFIIEESKRALKKGFQIHMLGLTLHSLLTSLLTHWKMGEIDNDVSSLMEIFLNEEIGEISSEKESIELANSLKEARKSKSCNSIEILVKMISFPSIMSVINPIIEALHSSKSTKVVGKLDTILKHVVISLIANSSTKSSDLLIFVHHLADKHLDSALSNDESVVCFSLNLFYSALKSDKFADEENKIGKLDPFVNIIRRCLNKCKSQSVIITAVKCLMILLKIPLPSMNVILADIVPFLFRSLTGAALLVQVCFKALALVIKQYETFSISDDQVKALIGFVTFDLEDSSKQSVAFGVIKSILSRKIILPELYDLMQRIGSILVKSDSDFVREQSIALYCNFLIQYPLAEKRRKQSVEFLVNNVTFEWPSGRISTLSALERLIQTPAFRDAHLEKYSETMFLSVVAQLGNEEDRTVSTKLSKVVNLLFLHSASSLTNNFLNFAVLWWNNSAESLKWASVHVFLEAVDALGNDFQKHLPILLDSLQPFLKSESDLLESLIESAKSGIESNFALLHYVLLIIEKCFLHLPAITEREFKNRVMWDNLRELSFHPHDLVRCTVSKIILLYVSKINYCIMDTLLLNSDGCFELGRSLCALLASASSELSVLTIQNLVSLSRILLDKIVFPEDLKENAKNIEISNLESDSDNEESSDVKFKSIAMEASDRITKELSASEGNRVLLWIFRRLSYMCRKNNMKFANVVFTYFDSMSKILSSTNISPYLAPMLIPLYSASVLPPDNDNCIQLKAQAENVLRSIEQVLGSSVYMDIFSKVRTTLMNLRAERKSKRAVLAITNPVAFAKRKVAQGLRKKDAKKRKTTTTKFKGKKSHNENDMEF